MNILYTVTHTPDDPRATRWKDELVEAQTENDAVFASQAFHFTGDYNRIKAVPVDVSMMTRVDIAVLRIPVAFRDMVRSVAYDRGHHAGEDEVGVIAEGMVADLIPCIAAYKKELLS